MSLAADAAVESIWRAAGLDPAALRRLQLPGSEPGLRSSFAVSTAAQASLGAAALAATEIGRVRNGLEQTASVDLVDAAVECTRPIHARRRRVPSSGTRSPASTAARPTERNEWVRVHTNFAHHRDGLLRLLGLPEGPDDLAARRWPTRSSAGGADALEDEAAARGLVVARAAQLRGMGPASAGDRRRRPAAGRDRAHRRRAAARLAGARRRARVRSRACACST